MTTGGNCGRNMRIKNELNSQITNKASSTIMTDKSPGDYVNRVTINIQEGADIAIDESREWSEEEVQ